MRNRIKREGRYELFLTTNDNTILSLDNFLWYAIAEGQRGEIIIKSDSNHQKKRTLQKGKYYLIDFKDDPDFQDMPHLLLESGGGQFDEWVLPRNLPSSSEKHVKLIRSSHNISEKKLKDRLKSPGPETQKKELEMKSRSSIYKIARVRNIKGRSRMTKDELIEAIYDD